MNSTPERFKCPTCGQSRATADRVSATRLRRVVRQQMAADKPEWDGKITCRACVHRYRIRLLREALEQQRQGIGATDAAVLERMEHNRMLVRDIEQAPQDLGSRVADKVAAFGGSWTFIGLFGFVIGCWMIVNVLLSARAFDPYPFILLNLVLSCLAAIQAPVILMSQNRQADTDRRRAENDYEVNLKAELEIHLLNDKLDHLLLEEWQQLIEIQALQSDMLTELHHKVSALAHKN